jgi:hypothetical protein
MGNLTMVMFDEVNAKHMKEHAHCTRQETTELAGSSCTSASMIVPE